MAIHFLFTGFLFALSIGENAADMSCHLAKVDGKPNKFAFRLWGKDIVRDCPVGKEFDAEKCRCDTKKPEKLEANEIVNGDLVDISEVPWIVAIGVKCPTSNNYGQLSHDVRVGHCTGSLIKPRWVLTAQHCEEHMYTNCKKYHPQTVSDKRKPTMFVEAGVSQYGQNLGEKVEVQAFYNHDVHPSMDIILMHLKTAIHITKNIKTIPVMTPDSSYWGKTCMIVGFGYQWKQQTGPKSWTGVQNTYLYKATTKVLPNDWKCPSDYYKGWARKKWHMCTQDEGGLTNICSGDSGGPLVCRDKRGVKRLVAVLSMGATYCAAGKPTIYVHVKHFLDRMKAVIKQVEGTEYPE